MRKIIPALLLPFTALAIWVALLEFRIITGNEVRLRITGYDPRDLLSGHFMRYNLDLGELEPCPNQKSGISCVCLAAEANNIYFAPTYQRDCSGIESDASCKIFLRGSCESGRFVTGLERYSIPEHWAPELQTLPPNSSAAVSLDSNGIGQVTAIFVENEPLESYVNKKQSAKESNPLEN